MNVMSGIDYSLYLNSVKVNHEYNFEELDWFCDRFEEVASRVAGASNPELSEAVEEAIWVCRHYLTKIDSEGSVDNNQVTEELNDLFGLIAFLIDDDDYFSVITFAQWDF